MSRVGANRAVGPKTRLAYTEATADADGHPMTAEQTGMPAGVPADSPGAAGWATAIDKLHAYVADLRR